MMVITKCSFQRLFGLTKKGWAFTAFGSRAWGDGYIQGTEFVGYNWFANISKIFNEHHSLSLTAFGAPQWHNQRSPYDGLSIEGWQQVGNYMKDDSQYKYNPTYGFGKNGERKMAARNEYHKPQISLNYNWSIDEVSSWSTVLYTSIGRGFGYSGQTTSAYSAHGMAPQTALSRQIPQRGRHICLRPNSEINEQARVVHKW